MNFNLSKNDIKRIKTLASMLPTDEFTSSQFKTALESILPSRYSRMSPGLPRLMNHGIVRKVREEEFIATKPYVERVFPDGYAISEQDYEDMISYDYQKMREAHGGRPIERERPDLPRVEIGPSVRFYYTFDLEHFTAMVREMVESLLEEV